jgi:nitrate/nitrite transporter NarK
LAEFDDSLTGVMKKKTTRYVNIAAMFKYLGEYAFLFFMPAYFQSVYPTMKMEFASANAISLSILGFISAVMGGIISDKYGQKHPMTMAWVCIIG